MTYCNLCYKVEYKGDKMKIVCIGHAAYDITIPVDGYPQENTKNRVENRIECGGGPASNAAYLLGCWGSDVEFVGVVGNDLYGKTIKEELEHVHVKTTNMKLNQEYTTTSSFIIANTKVGSRTILTYRPHEMKWEGNLVLDNPDIILMDGQEYELSKKILKQYKDAISIIDAGRPVDEVIELSHMVDYIVCSHEFAESMTNTSLKNADKETLETCFKKMEEIFKNHIIITLESTGSLYRDQDTIKLMPAIKVKAVDSTGAGDLFHGAFTYAISKKLPMEKVMQIATVAGGISVTKLGGRNSVATKEEMRRYIHDFE